MAVHKRAAAIANVWPNAMPSYIVFVGCKRLQLRGSQGHNVITRGGNQ